MVLVAILLINNKAKMKNDKIKAAIELTGMNRRECAEYLEVNVCTVGRWLNGELDVKKCYYDSLKLYMKDFK